MTKTLKSCEGKLVYRSEGLSDCQGMKASPGLELRVGVQGGERGHCHSVRKLSGRERGFLACGVVCFLERKSKDLSKAYSFVIACSLADCTCWDLCSVEGRA